MSLHLFRTLASANHNTGTGLTPISLYEEHHEGQTDKFQSITAHAKFSNFSLEELRVMDYQQERGSVGAASLVPSKSNHAALLSAASRSKSRRDRTHLELLRGPSIEVCVGPPSRCECQISWTLPTALISHHSAFLKAACSRNFKEKEENRITLPNDEATVFGLFIEWMYYGEYNVSQSVPLLHVANKGVNVDIGCWILGDKLLSIAFKNYVMHRLYERYTSDFTWRPVTTHDVQYVCENTAVDSKLRHFFLAFVVENFAHPMRLKGTTEEWDELLLDHSDARSFLLRSFRMTPEKRKFVKAESEYMDKDEPLHDAFGGMRIGGSGTT